MLLGMEFSQLRTSGGTKQECGAQRAKERKRKEETFNWPSLEDDSELEPRLTLQNQSAATAAPTMRSPTLTNNVVPELLRAGGASTTAALREALSRYEALVNCLRGARLSLPHARPPATFDGMSPLLTARMKNLCVYVVP